MTTGDRSKVVLVLGVLLISAFLALSLKNRSIRELPALTYHTNKAGTLYAGVRIVRDLELPFIVVSNMNLSGTTLLARPEGWVDESWVLSARWNNSTGYSAIAAVPWERWKLQLRAIQYRQFRLGPFKLNLAPQTNVWISPELLSRKELWQKSNLTLSPLPN